MWILWQAPALRIILCHIFWLEKQEISGVITLPVGFASFQSGDVVSDVGFRGPWEVCCCARPWQSESESFVRRATFFAASSQTMFAFL